MPLLFRPVGSIASGDTEFGACDEESCSSIPSVSSPFDENSNKVMEGRMAFCFEDQTKG